MKKTPLVSVIVTTYNWPDALGKVISAVLHQNYPNFEIIVADDGSKPQTLQCIQQLQQTYKQVIKHIWQPDEGFQAAKIRNKAAAMAEGEYLIFLDGDCIPFKNFVKRHVKLAERGWFVSGNRILLTQHGTHEIINNFLELTIFNLCRNFFQRKKRLCNRLAPLVFLPFWPRKMHINKWQGAKSCNLAIWKSDFLNINGFDESYHGWGFEDSDLIIRLFNLGIKRKDGRFALPVVHLWHNENDRSNERENLQRFKNRLDDNIIKAAVGVNQYLGDN